MDIYTCKLIGKGVKCQKLERGLAMCPLHASYCLWAKFYFIIAHEVVSLFWLLLLVFMLKLHVQSYHAAIQCNDYLRAYAFTMVSTCGSGIIQAEVQHKFYRVYLPEAT